MTKAKRKPGQDMAVKVPRADLYQKKAERMLMDHSKVIKKR